jgi:hypothetical protein
MRFYKDELVSSGYGPTIDLSLLVNVIAATTPPTDLHPGTITWNGIPTALVVDYAVNGFFWLLEGRPVLPPTSGGQIYTYDFGNLQLVVSVIDVDASTSNLRMDLVAN